MLEAVIEAGAESASEAHEITWLPWTRNVQRVCSNQLLDALEENDDVQNVYANFDVPDAVMQKLSD
jgi:transcriptional/translational regulatory protein YebC/TACO1